MNRMHSALSIAFLYNFAVSMVVLLIPLFVDDLGISPVILGLIVALPSALEMTLRLPAGRVADRVGERKILLGTGAGLALAGPLFSTLNVGLIAVGQPLTGVARAAYWPSAISYVTKIPGGRMGRKMGLFHSLVSLGGVMGPLLGGFLIAYLGYRGAFLAFTVISLSYLIAIWQMPSPPRHPAAEDRPSEPLLSTVRRIAGSRPVILAFLAGLGASTPLTLNSSFMPVYLRQVGLGDEMVGMLTSLHAVFLMVGHITFAQVFDLLTRQSAWIIGMAGIGVTVILIPLFSSALPLAAALGFLGLVKSPLQILPGVIMSESTREDERAMALAVSGMSWGLNLAVTPPLLGAIAQLVSVEAAFYAAGVPVLLLAFLVRPLFRWSYAETSRRSP